MLVLIAHPTQVTRAVAHTVQVPSISRQMSMTVISFPSISKSADADADKAEPEQAVLPQGLISAWATILFFFLLLLSWGSVSQSHAIRRQGADDATQTRRGTKEKRLRMDAYRGQLIACLLHLRLLRLPFDKSSGGLKTDQTLVRGLGTCTWQAQCLRC